MGTNELRVSLSCSCGRWVIARAKDAGGSVACVCGKQVAVPRLSELRTLAGADAFVTNPAEAIRKLQSEGINPAGERCLLCGSNAAVLYECQAVCESSYMKKSSSDDSYSLPQIFLSILFLPRIFFIPLMMLRKNDAEPDERRGHDVAVTFTLPVCDPCATTVGNITRPKIAKQLMAKVPVLNELLTYYPRLELTVERPATPAPNRR
jgi:hypothetical protein